MVFCILHFVLSLINQSSKGQILISIKSELLDDAEGNKLFLSCWLFHIYGMLQMEQKKNGNNYPNTMWGQEKEGKNPFSLSSQHSKALFMVKPTILTAAV